MAEAEEEHLADDGYGAASTAGSTEHNDNLDVTLTANTSAPASVVSVDTAVSVADDSASLLSKINPGQVAKALRLASGVTGIVANPQAVLAISDFAEFFTSYDDIGTTRPSKLLSSTFNTESFEKFSNQFEQFLERLKEEIAAKNRLRGFSDGNGNTIILDEDTGHMLVIDEKTGKSSLELSESPEEGRTKYNERWRNVAEESGKAPCQFKGSFNDVTDGIKGLRGLSGAFKRACSGTMTFIGVGSKCLFVLGAGFALYDYEQKMKTFDELVEMGAFPIPKGVDPEKYLAKMREEYDLIMKGNVGQCTGDPTLIGAEPVIQGTFEGFCKKYQIDPAYRDELRPQTILPYPDDDVTYVGTDFYDSIPDEVTPGMPPEVVALVEAKQACEEAKRVSEQNRGPDPGSMSGFGFHNQMKAQGQMAVANANFDHIIKEQIEIGLEDPDGGLNVTIDYIEQECGKQYETTLDPRDPASGKLVIDETNPGSENQPAVYANGIPPTRNAMMAP